MSVHVASILCLVPILGVLAPLTWMARSGRTA
jgi:hypothetical protein